MSHGARVLVVDDDQGMITALSLSLGVEGLRVGSATTGATALTQARLQPPQAIVLDLTLPDMDGLEVLERLRAWSQVPVIVLSGDDAEATKIRALRAGADDYVVKPHLPGELAARLWAVMRRASSPPAGPRVRFADVEIDLARRVVYRAGMPVHLTAREYAVLSALARRDQHVVAFEELLQEVWGPGTESERQYLRVYVGRLRAKLEPDPRNPRHLITQVGVGYRLRLD